MATNCEVPLHAKFQICSEKAYRKHSSDKNPALGSNSASLDHQCSLEEANVYLEHISDLYKTILFNA